ncbi:MAG TPA: RidA family protein [Parafilimonas sp.]|nr:RidA family protein [Parafilimonas sp.]
MVEGNIATCLDITKSSFHYQKNIYMKQIIQTEKAPAPIGPYSQAIKAGGLLFISGQVAIDPATNEVIKGSVKDEARQVMKNIESILKDANLTFQHVVKTTIFLTDMNLFAEVNEVYGSYFDGDYPARETVAVKGLPKNVNVEISMIASVSI